MIPINKMKKISILFLTLATSFCLGFTFKTIVSKHSNEKIKMKRVTGIGGIFFKCEDPNKIKERYNTHLGLNTDLYGTTFEWQQAADTTRKGFTQWSPFTEKTKYFEPSTKEFMINYRVENIEILVEELKKEGATIVEKSKRMSMENSFI